MQMLMSVQMTLIQKHLTTVIISAQTHLAVTTVAVTKDMSFLQMDTHALVANITTTVAVKVPMKDTP